MIEKLSHIGIAVKSLEERIPFYRDVLGLEEVGRDEVPGQGVRVAMFKVGRVNIELLEPTDPNSTIARFLESSGEGLHHLAFQTDNVDGELERLEAEGVKLIDQKPRAGAHGTRIAFLHPKSTGKVLMELCQPGGKHDE